MKILGISELVKVPVGTIFRKFEPCVWNDDWSIFQGECNPGSASIGYEDFFYGDIGPQFIMNGCDKEHPYDHFRIDSGGSRDGCFEPDQLFLVLDPEDVQAMIRQLQGLDVENHPVLRISDPPHPR